MSRHSRQVLVEVSDDGVGGADPATGSGLRGLLDRVSAVGGRFEVDSRPGQGTTVRATIPCELASPKIRSRISTDEGAMPSSQARGQSLTNPEDAGTAELMGTYEHGA